MNISPAILGRHLHDAAIEQLATDLGGEGYEVEREASIGDAKPPFRADLIARRGGDAIVYEVKVLGDRSEGNLAHAAKAARAIGAQFRLVIVRPQRRVGIEIKGAADLVLQAFHDLGPAPLAPVTERLGEGWRAAEVTDVELDSVAWRGDGIEVSGSAVVRLSRPGDDLPLALQAAFTLWLDGEQRFTQPPRLAVDTSDLDD